MPIRVSGAALAEIQRLFDWGAMGSWTDGQLIERFLAGHEESEAAFRVLIERHGPMVLGVCRRILGDAHAAEDAFQATFLVFVKKAGRLRDSGRLTSWLYGVALRVSHKERARGERRREVERHAAERAPRTGGGTEPHELGMLIEEEIRRLPERYRTPLLLCHMEGLRHDEVARRLGCPVGTVESRLSRAREQLRKRLARHGLEPSAPAISALIGPPAIGPVPPSLVEATLRMAMNRPVLAAVAPAVASALPGRAGRATVGLSLRARMAAAGIVIGLGITAVGLGRYQAEEPGPRPTPTAPEPRIERPPAEPLRLPQAIARPMSGITIDGRLEDWPGGLPRYPIRNVYTGDAASYRTSVDGPLDIDAEFLVGYDAPAGLIYMAIVVRDNDHVVKRSSSCLDSDAVEVYVDGTFSDREMAVPSSGDWSKVPDAAEMPVLQYAGIAGNVPAYGDRYGANPSLLYAKTREPRTRMRYRREGRETTYEWAIRAYDRFPDEPTQLEPGKRIGLEVAVMDKDSGRTKPAFLSWGPPPVRFKGFDAGSLGELFLAEGP
jgi:RNA polymerase sigma factor (sigma-70 family)